MPAEAAAGSLAGERLGRAGAEPWSDDAAGSGAALSVRAGGTEARARLSPAGAVAIGLLVTGVLLGAAAVVRASLAPARRHPWATAWALRRRRR